MVWVLSPMLLAGPRSVSFASPKSSTFTRPESVTMMLPGLRSRWTIPAACAALSASAICTPYFKRLRRAKPAFRNQIDQSFAGDELHHHVIAFRLIHDVVNGDDVGMVQAGGGLGFLNKAAAAFGVAGIGAWTAL